MQATWLLRSKVTLYTLTLHCITSSTPVTINNFLISLSFLSGNLTPRPPPKKISQNCENKIRSLFNLKKENDSGVEFPLLAIPVKKVYKNVKCALIPLKHSNRNEKNILTENISGKM